MRDELEFGMTYDSESIASNKPVANSRRLRFSLATLVLAIALGLAILANVLQHLEARRRDAEVFQLLGHWHQNYGNYYDIAGVEGEDPAMIHVSFLPTGRDDEWIWQISLAEGSEFRICYTVEGITERGFPRFQAATAPLAGNVWIKFSWRHPPDRTEDGVIAWFAPQSRSGSSAHGWLPIPPKDLSILAVAGHNKREAFNPDSPVELLRMRDKDSADDAGTSTSGGTAPRAGFLVWIERIK